MTLSGKLRRISILSQEIIESGNVDRNSCIGLMMYFFRALGYSLSNLIPLKNQVGDYDFCLENHNSLMYVKVVDLESRLHFHHNDLQSCFDDFNTEIATLTNGVDYIFYYREGDKVVKSPIGLNLRNEPANKVVQELIQYLLYSNESFTKAISHLKSYASKNTTPFYTVKPDIDKAPLQYFLLTLRSWDDFGYKCEFQLSFHNSSTDWPIHIGDVKIMNRQQSKRSKVELPKTFKALDSNEFCSLGQRLDYYGNIMKLEGCQSRPLDVLEALADIPTSKREDKWWEGLEVYSNSLIRFEPACMALEGALSLVEGVSPSIPNSITLELSAYSESPQYKYTITFDEKKLIPNRLNVIIGKNGAGKTTILNQMLSVMSKVQKVPFLKLIFVSTNSFDNINLSDSETSEIKFVGQKPGQKNLMISSRNTAINHMRKDKRKNWPQALSTLFPMPESLLRLLPSKEDALIEELKSARSIIGWEDFITKAFDDHRVTKLIVDYPEESIRQMSAGQQALSHIYAGLFINVDMRSLILMDEPENFLHPSLISRFIKNLNELLSEKEAFSIITTHSPLIIQETPRSQVTIMDRNDKEVLFIKPNFETFGESIENISEYLFETDFASSNWKKVIDALIDKGFGDDEIASAIGDLELSFFAQSYLSRRRLLKEMNLLKN